MDMKTVVSNKKNVASLDIGAVCARILKTQKESGEIPWHDGGKTDPWDHVEAAMGLCVGGYFGPARRAFEWLAVRQLEDGSWPSSWRDGEPADQTRDANMSSYIAVGALYYHLVTGDMDFLRDMWETVRAAIDFALGLQGEEGQIFWAVSPEGKVDRMSLLTGSSSVFFSAKCALEIARRLGRDMASWRRALKRLKEAINDKPHLFNAAKSRHSMDWFYPALSGAVTGAAAEKRIDRRWKKYMVDGQGVLCVSDEPWVTMAETSELALTLAAMGNRDQAGIVFDWISHKVFEDGSFWCGHTYPDMTVWPEEKMTWTNGVALIAADAIFHLTPAFCLFYHSSWDGDDFSFKGEGAPGSKRPIAIHPSGKGSVSS
jgi:hypothetical protein